MKILHVVPYFAPAWGYGGPPRAVYELAKQQIKAGHKVTVLTTTANDQSSLPAGKTVIDKITVVRLPNVSNYLIWKFHFSTPIGVESYISGHTFDVIHLHEVRTLLNYFVLKNVSDTVKIVLSPWGTLPYNGSMIVIKKLLDLFFLPLLRKKVSTSFGQTTHEVNELILWMIGNKKLLVPLAISNINHLKLDTQIEARKKLAISPNSFVVLYLGRFSPYKGLSLLLRSFAQFAEGKNNVSLALVGRDDGYEIQLKNLITKYNLTDKVILTGPMYDTDRFIAYRSANVFLFCPSVYEETGTVCLEALAAGIPVITSREAEIPFLKVKDGVIHTKRNSRQISVVLEKLYMKGLNVNRNKLEKYFYWPQVSKKIFQGYDFS